MPTRLGSGRIHGLVVAAKLDRWGIAKLPFSLAPSRFSPSWQNAKMKGAGD